MARPPATPPSSDVDGVNEDDSGTIDAANDAGQDGADLARARDEAAGRPDFAEDRPNRDDRSR